MSKLQNIKRAPQQTDGYTTPAVIRRNQPETPPPGTWNGKQTAAFFGVCYRTFMKKVAAGNIPYMQFGRQKRFSPAEMERRLATGDNNAAATGSEND